MITIKDVPKNKQKEFYKLKTIVDTYNGCIDELEQMGIVVGNEYNGHMNLGYNRHDQDFFVSVQY